MSRQQKYFFDCLITAIAPLLWGSTYIITTQILPPERPFSAAAIRVLPAGLLLLAWCRHLPERSWWPRLLILAGLNIGVFQALLFIAAYRLPGGLAAIFGALQPLIMLLLTSLIDKQIPRLSLLLMAALGLPGMFLLLWAPEMHWDGLGVAAALTGVCCIASGSFLTRRWRPPMSVVALTAWQCTLGGLMLLPLALWQDPPLPALNLEQGLAYAYLSLFGALLAYLLWIRGIQKLPLVATSSLSLLSPLVAVLLGWLILQQRLGGVALCGMLLVLCSVFLVQRDAAKSVAARA